ncbi:MAG TPA: TonB-dependent siderophore receptor [Methylophilaceae bacterium]|nr:TonB-dependent siderophore receptor [Methylophilaceae bacterium]
MKFNSNKTNRKRMAALVALAIMPAYGAENAPMPAESDEAMLPEVTINTSREASVPYRAETSSTATRIETELRDIPQSISIVTKELIESQRAFSLRDALRNVSGLTIAAGEGGRTGDSITLRGYAASSDMYLDGVKDNGQYNRDTFFLERVEVLKGASSIMFGRGSTGGIINQVAKHADGEERLEADVSYGSFDNRRVTIDAGTAINDVVSVRLNALWNDADSFRDYNFTDRKGLAPSVKFKFNDTTDLTLDYLYQREDSVFDYGLPMFQGRPADVSTRRFYGFRDDRKQEYETDVATATLRHKFTEDFSVRNTLRYGDYYRIYRTNLVSGINQNAATATFSQALRDSHQQNLINQTDFVLTTPLMGMANTLAFGFEYGKEDFDFRSKNSPGSFTTSIFNPVFPATWPNGSGAADDFSGTLNSNRQVEAKTRAAYVQDQLEITRQWKVLAGIRYDAFRVDQTDLVNPANSDFDTGTHQWSPRVGLTWQPTETQSYYVSYGESFNPAAEQFALIDTVSEQNLDPETNSNKEIGAKWDLFNRRLSITSAIFRLEKDNARSTDASGLTTLSGSQRTDGFELGVAGEVAHNWNVSAAYAYMDAEVTDSTAVATGSVSGITNISLQGMTPQNVPKNSGTIWTTYRFLQNWEIGGGIYAVGSRYTDNVNEVELPGYARLDAVLAYHQPRYDVQLNIFNLLDKKYFESGQVRSALPGVPLSGMLTVSLRY